MQHYLYIPDKSDCVTYSLDFALLVCYLSRQIYLKQIHKTIAVSHLLSLPLSSKEVVSTPENTDPQEPSQFVVYTHFACIIHNFHFHWLHTSSVLWRHIKSSGVPAIWRPYLHVFEKTVLLISAFFPCVYFLENAVLSIWAVHFVPCVSLLFLDNTFDAILCDTGYRFALTRGVPPSVFFPSSASFTLHRVKRI
jgi:hypothetical protein